MYIQMADASIFIVEFAVYISDVERCLVYLL